jgi:hypothetical protein
MSARDRRRSDNLARGATTATFLRLARTAKKEGRAEDEAWLRGKAADRWSQRKARASLTAEQAEGLLERMPADSPSQEAREARAEAMALLTLLKSPNPGLEDRVQSLSARLEDRVP